VVCWRRTFANHGEHIQGVVRGEQQIETKWRPYEKVSGVRAAMMLLALSTNVALRLRKKRPFQLDIVRDKSLVYAHTELIWDFLSFITYKAFVLSAIRC